MASQVPPQTAPRKRGCMGCLVPALIVAGVLVVLIIVVAVVGASQKGTAVSGTPTPPPSVGSAVVVKNWTLTVVHVDHPGQTITWSSVGNTSKAVGTWLVIQVELKNTGTQNFGVNGPDFSVLSGAVHYDVSSDLGAISYSSLKGGANLGGQVPPGVTATYYLVFDIAPNAANLQLRFNQDTKPVIALGS